MAGLGAGDFSAAKLCLIELAFKNSEGDFALRVTTSESRHPLESILAKILGHDVEVAELKLG
ncbi:hypothetical protein EPO05_05195 [Patescibacteria group bacterium]|nr:MAG: hypothetical protein EPO05_05195 [Patescibacteria group bacterium]